MTTAYLTDTLFLQHDYPNHPEHAGRLRRTWAALSEHGVLPKLTTPTQRPAPISDSALASLHTSEYLAYLRQASTLNQSGLLNSDTYWTPKTYDAARLAAGLAVAAVDEVLTARADNALVLARPPGHHAMPDQAMGFCIFGNIALAAQHARDHHQLERVLILDYDVHHGNGSEAMFYDDPSVLFISLHQYDPHPFYPGTGALHDTGDGRGTGYTLNIPLAPRTGDAQYAALFEAVVWPAVLRFQPQLILVSAGFDAHFADPLAQIQLSLNGYDHLTRELIRMAQQVCHGRIVFVMEGGYNLDALSYGWVNIANALLGDATVLNPLGHPTPHSAQHAPDVSGLIAELKRVHRL
jgi:acetoin utilization deacetylase AcuC-like enzyme